MGWDGAITGLGYGQVCAHNAKMENLFACLLLDPIANRLKTDSKCHRFTAPISAIFFKVNQSSFIKILIFS